MPERSCLVFLSKTFWEYIIQKTAPGALEAAQKIPKPGDQQTELQSHALPDVVCQLVPLDEVITFVPLLATATKTPKSGDQHTLFQ
jgi:hypothetical protein